MSVFAVRTKRAAAESFLTEARQAIWSVDKDCCWRESARGWG